MCVLYACYLRASACYVCVVCACYVRAQVFSLLDAAPDPRRRALAQFYVGQVLRRAKALKGYSDGLGLF